MWLSGGFIAEVALALGVVMLGFHMVMQIVAAVTLITPTAFNKNRGLLWIHQKQHLDSNSHAGPDCGKCFSTCPT